MPRPASPLWPAFKLNAQEALGPWPDSKIGVMRKLGPTLLVVGLLAATATSFAVTEGLKLEDSPVLGTKITRLFSPRKAEARIGFRLRREEDLRLDIADAEGTVIRHGIGSGLFGQARHRFAWDGRDDAGRIVPDGTYGVELTLKDEGRTIEFPNEVRVDSTPPTIQDVKPRHAVFSPDGDGHADRVDLRYRFSEPAVAILYLNGKRVGRSHSRQRSGTISWYGRGRRSGEYRLALAAQDLAGNLGPSTREFTVHIRYLQLLQRRYRSRGGTVRVRVSTDVTAVRWRLGGRSGVGRPPLLKIPAPQRRGRYRLVLTANGHRARATVVVGS